MRLSSNIMRLYAAFGIYKTIDIFADAGITAIDFNCDIKEFHDGTHEEQFFCDLRKYANDRGVVFGQSHAPFASSYADENMAEKRFNEIVSSIRYTSYLGAPYIVVHPCQHYDYNNTNKEAIYRYNLDFYRRLIPYSEQYGVKIALENINQKGGESICSTPERLMKLYDELDNDAFVICFDVGHVNMLGINPADAIRTLGGRIKCLHVHDNDGAGDTHTLPYYGTVAWEDVAKALGEIGYDGTVNYEASGFLKNLPVELYEAGVSFMSRVGHHLIERICYYKSQNV